MADTLDDFAKFFEKVQACDVVLSWEESDIPEVDIEIKVTNVNHNIQTIWQRFLRKRNENKNEI